MKAYVIANFNLLDADKLKQYGKVAAETVANYNGEYIVKGATDYLHGSSNYETKVIIQFADKETALKWYHSKAYQSLISIRNEAIESLFQVVG